MQDFFEHILITGYERAIRAEQGQLFGNRQPDTLGTATY
jgi:hypothetical protein